MPNAESNPLLTIITPIHDGAAYFLDLLDDLQTQLPEANWLEWVIIYDGPRSCDEFLAGRNLPDYGQWLIGEGQGATAALNLGIRETTAPYLHFLMGDDHLELENLHAMIMQIAKVELQPDIVTAGNRFILDNDTARQTPPFVVPLDWRNVLYGTPCLGGRVYHRSLFDRIGCFDADFTYCSDREFLIRALLADATHLTLPEYCIHKYRIHAGSLSMGGNLPHIRRFLAQHIEIAKRHSQGGNTREDTRKEIRNWMNYETMRVIYYSAKTRNYADAGRMLMALLLRNPASVFGILKGRSIARSVQVDVKSG